MGKRMAMLGVLLVAGFVLIGMRAVAPNGFSAGKAIPFLGMENGNAEWIVGDEPGVWIGKEAINEALTEGTENNSDDEGPEFVHEIEWEKAGMKPISFDTAEEALEFATDEIQYKSDFENYGVMEAWANPEKTLKKDSGDCEDKAILLASLLKFHTEEYAKNDMVFVRIAPYYGGLHAQVVWKHLQSWYLLDPTSGYTNRISSPTIGAYGTLWFNDETVKGWLPGYYEPQEQEPNKPEIYPKPQLFEFHHYEREFHRGKIIVIPEQSYKEIPLPEGAPEKTNLTYKITISNGTLTITENGEVMATTNLSEGEKFVYSTNDPIYLHVEVSLEGEKIFGNIEANTQSTYCSQTFSRNGEISVVIEVQGNSICFWGK
ncbi:MAG: transglutaminase family protein [Thermoplasmata archaeon]|nr:transglutaminase family protein [Thermoplasmata archaeon]